MSNFGDLRSALKAGDLKAASVAVIRHPHPESVAYVCEHFRIDFVENLGPQYYAAFLWWPNRKASIKRPMLAFLYCYGQNHSHANKLAELYNCEALFATAQSNFMAVSSILDNHGLNVPYPRLCKFVGLVASVEFSNHAVDLNFFLKNGDPKFKTRTLMRHEANLEWFVEALQIAMSAHPDDLSFSVSCTDSTLDLFNLLCGQIIKNFNKWGTE